MQKHLKKHAFTLWLLLGVVLAILFPEPGAKGGILHAELTTKIGVSLIFLLQGLSLPTSELTTGYKPKRLHTFVLSWNYLLFPLVVGLLLLPLALILPEELRLGFWLLAILPTTVSSAVVFSTVSGGNTANAIFATVFSNLLSVLLVPTVAVTYLATETEANISLIPLFTKLFTLIILPLILGQIFRKALPVLSASICKITKPWSNWIIIFIVHCAFAQSVRSGFLDGLSGGSILAVIGSTVFVLLLVSQLVWWSSAWLKPTRAQRISAFYCASQKSLATGLPLTTSILAAAPGTVDAAAVLIPLMCYHPAQLVLAGFISGRFAKEPTENGTQ
ncbi:bile acid:sodium symporter family protein [Coraliomargarita algicola]|uniref:Bile acid:sodium symporter family protein n=1 Tax=Coraliomargarita algicola TaxID=3092156 RepID=A0ABZ0RH48_9BACT|nr:bile acid:sodium symporter family protein [Coraliomargarita sp. J2-16]WPJ94569.1 bile acid:sodium symporter family protein [Coraliomargarita sp. J2-16]